MNISELRKELETMHRTAASNEQAMRQEIEALNTAKDVATAELKLYKAEKERLGKLLDAMSVAEKWDKLSEPDISWNQPIPEERRRDHPF
jgi:hypothetical protein